MRLGLWWALGLLRVSLTTLGPLRLDNRRRRVDLFTQRNKRNSYNSIHYNVLPYNVIRYNVIVLLHHSFTS